MEFFFTKEASEVTKIKEGTIRQYISRGKIISEKDSDGRNKIPKSEVMRLKKEKEKIDSGKYLSADDLERKGLPRKIMFDGSLETVILLNNIYASWEEVKGWMLRNPSNDSAISERHEKTVQVLNKKGIHCAPSTMICEICKKYYDRSHTQCEIYFDGHLWHYPVDQCRELLKMGITYLKRIIIIGIGEESRELLKELSQAFNNRFGLE